MTDDVNKRLERIMGDAAKPFEVWYAQLHPAIADTTLMGSLQVAFKAGFEAGREAAQAEGEEGVGNE